MDASLKRYTTDCTKRPTLQTSTFGREVGNLEAAGVLIDAGINVNRAGDLGYNPLQQCCLKGNKAARSRLLDRTSDWTAGTDYALFSLRLLPAIGTEDRASPLIAPAASYSPVMEYQRTRNIS